MAMLQTDEPSHDPHITIGRLYYLGQPYGHRDDNVLQMRYKIALLTTMELMNQGHHIYSPIVHNHDVIKSGGPESGWHGSFWKDYDLNVLSRCDGLIVMCIQGWKESVGLTHEIKFAKESGIAIYYHERSMGRTSISPIQPDMTLPPLP